MKIVKIIVQVLLALVFLMVGFMKASTPYDEMIVTEGPGPQTFQQIQS